MDVSTILDGTYSTDKDCEVDSHNDIFDIEMAEVINYAISNMMKK